MMMAMLSLVIMMMIPAVAFASGNGYVSISNVGDSDICWLYMEPVNNDEWGEIGVDFGENELLPPDHSIEFRLEKSSPNNMYNVVAYSCSDELMLDVERVVLPGKEYAIDWWTFYEIPSDNYPSPIGGIPCPPELWPCNDTPPNIPAPCPDSGAWPPGCNPNIPSIPDLPEFPGVVPCPESGAWPAGCNPNIPPIPGIPGIPCPGDGTWPAGCDPNLPMPEMPEVPDYPCSDNGTWPPGCTPKPPSGGCGTWDCEVMIVVNNWSEHDVCTVNLIDPYQPGSGEMLLTHGEKIVSDWYETFMIEAGVYTVVVGSCDSEYTASFYEQELYKGSEINYLGVVSTQ